jgi:hypothetical protein
MKEFIVAVAVAVLTASPAFAAVKHHNRAPERSGGERLDPSIFQSNSQGNQSYPNPDRQFYVPQWN